MSLAYFNLSTGDFVQEFTLDQIITNDDWSNVPSLTGYVADLPGTTTGVDPQTLTSAPLGNAQVFANTTGSNPSAGGIYEVTIGGNRTVAFNGSGTVDAPSVVLRLDATGRENLHLTFDVYDLDANDNAVQQFAVMYRLGDSGAWTNLPNGYIADATGAGATLVTQRSFDLPAELAGQANIQLRFLTTNAVGSDELIGLDNLKVTSTAQGGPPPAAVVSISDVTVTEGAGVQQATFTVTRTHADGAFTLQYGTQDGAAQAGSDYQAASGTLTFTAGGALSQTVTVTINGDAAIEPDETFKVLLTNLQSTSGTAQIGDGEAVGTITNDDFPPAVVGAPWINEFHYDNVGADTNEFIEIAGPAGLSLTGYKLVLYNGNPDQLNDYRTINLTGTITDQSNGMGTITFPASGLQNGGAAGDEPDAIALVGPDGKVIEFFSYEGSFTAASGPATGMTSINVGVAEDGGTPTTGSIARVGAGFEGADFHWQLSANHTSGGVNAGQTFTAPTARVSVGDASVTEGANGTTILTFTVSRSGLPDAFQVTYATADGTAQAGSDYAATSGTLSFGVGETSKTVTVTVNGDLAPELSETLVLNLSNPTNGATIGDGQGTGRIVNDDYHELKIYQIQGAGHVSAYDGQDVLTEGVVTAVDTTGSGRGFWIQDPDGDGDNATSDGIFVFVGSAGALNVAVGDKVQVRGTVDEFGSGNNLTTTEIVNPTVTKVGTGSVTATVLGAGGRVAPAEAVGDDEDVFDPTTQGMDFYESLEGMLVVVPNAQATDLTNGGSTWVVSDAGAGTSSLNDRGGVTIAGGDMNPERIEVFVDSGVLPGVSTSYDMGDRLGDVTGVVHYFGGNYEVVATGITNTTGPGSPPDDVTALVGDATHLTIAAYNLENIDPNDPQAKFDALASDIVVNLRSPDIIGVEEIQDADGAGSGANLSGQATAQKLIDAIVAAGGPRYVYVEVAPAAAGTSGGEPGGNIRQGFLYNADRVQYVDGSARLVDPDNAAYEGSRKPLAADFVFRGETITAIDLHSTSRIGSDEGVFGDRQPPFNAGETQRIAQSEAVHQFVLALQAANPGQHVAVMGDFNGFQFERSLTVLEQGGSLTNLSWLLPADERYSYVFDGNSQQIDHMLVSGGLYQTAEFDVVHLNSGKAGFRPTDHDPVLGRFLVNTGPVAVADAATVSEDQTVVVDVLANDTDRNTGDTRTLVSVTGQGQGSVSIVDGKVVYVADADAFDLLGPGQTATETLTYVMRDAAGATSTSTVEVTIAGVADGPTQVGGNGADLVNGTAADELLDGGNGADRVFGFGGADTLLGANGSDQLFGGAGIDSLSGGNGADVLDGGAGADWLAGGEGADRFVFTGAFGRDVVADFGNGDQLQFDLSLAASFSDLMAHAQQVGDDVVISFDAATAVTLQDVSLASLRSGDFLFV